MKVLIIEDEYHAQKRLSNLVTVLRPNVEILACIDSVEESVEWLQNNPLPDLLFLDIQLSDGLSFEIFTKVNIQTPVIFTTAFDDYAIKAFQLNSIDYLLKPIEEEDLERAISKYENHFQKKLNIDLNTVQNILDSIQQPKYKSRFLIKSGQNISYIPIASIAYIFSENSFSFIKTVNGKKHLLDGTIDKIEESLNPENFLRINRKMILKIEAIQKVSPYFNSRLILKVKPEANFEVIVSRERVKAFKVWLGG